MTLEAAAAIGVLAVAALLLVTLAASALHRSLRLRRERRRGARLAVIRPYLVAMALGEDDPGEAGGTGAAVLPAVADLAARNSDLLEEAALDLLGKLRGEAHDDLVAVLAERGTLAEARQRLRSRSADSRALAALLLGAAGDADSVEDVAGLLHDPAPEVARVAARTLGKQGDPRAVAPLLAAVDGPRALPVGLVAASLLGIGAPAVEPLIDGLGGRAGRSVGRDDAGEFAGGDAEPARPPDGGRAGRSVGGEDAWEFAGGDGEPARPPDGAAGTTGRVAAAEVLGRLGAVEATDPLIHALLHDPEREVRLRCAHALGRIGAPKAAAPLTDVANTTEDPVMRAICVRALGEVGGTGAVRALVSAVNAPEHSVAANAAGALVTVGPAGVGALESLVAGGGRGAPYAREALAFARLRTPSLVQESRP